MMMGEMVRFADEAGLVPRGTTLAQVAPDAFRLYARQERVLVQPESVGGATPRVKRDRPHPVAVVVVRQDVRLSAFRVLAAFRARGWTPAKWEYAVEFAGKLLDDGEPRQTADLIAVLRTRDAFAVSACCATCAHHRPTPAGCWGACALHDVAVQPTQCCTDFTRRVRVDEIPTATSVPLITGAAV